MFDGLIVIVVSYGTSDISSIPYYFTARKIPANRILLLSTDIETGVSTQIRVWNLSRESQTVVEKPCTPMPALAYPRTVVKILLIVSQFSLD